MANPAALGTVAVVRNAADPVQVARGGKHEKSKRDQDLRDMRDLLATLPGRRTLWRILEQCGLFETITRTDEHSIYVLSGMRDIGLWLQQEIIQGHEDAFLLMIQENHARAKRDARDIVAGQTKSGSEE